MQAQRDDNAAYTITGVSTADGVTPLRVRVDPVTGYVLATIQTIANFATTNPKSKPDDNGIRVKEAVTNDANQTVKPVLSDPNHTGYILADVSVV